ncbi:hypothetical protein [uncultured Cloacibacillus sp.]|uniref:hypothetical protein n=1 Tax=uncultured Cloacibacillus sp. TaxID=889794 RepID=UPI0027D9B065|nr:hypothetical protein [uncultured Cloacibacillus sp.]
MSNARENRMTAPTRDTHANWTTNNPVLPEGVLGIVKDRRYSGSVEYIVGDGVTAYSALKKFGDVHRADGKIDPNELCIVGALGAGAIIESGSNSNGSYTKWADGTMVCINAPILIGYYIPQGATLVGQWPYPASFVSSPVISVTYEGGSSDYIRVATTDVSPTHLPVWLVNTYTQPLTLTIRLSEIAIGQWKA